MNMSSTSVLALALVSVLGLSACGGDNIRKELGLIGEGPDEFTVVKRKPLTMPNNLDQASLPQPQPGAPNLVDPRPLEDAQRALQGEATPGATSPSSAETAFIAAAGAGEADDAVRDQMTAEVEEKPELILNRLLGKGAAREDPLDPATEADRLARQAQATKNPALELPTETADEQ